MNEVALNGDHESSPKPLGHGWVEDTHRPTWCHCGEQLDGGEMVEKEKQCAVERGGAEEVKEVRCTLMWTA